MEGIPTNWLIPLGTIAAALIAGCFSFLNLVISKEQKVSEFRQAWIDKLRDDISEYVASISFLAVANKAWVQEKRQDVLEHHKAMQSSFGAASHTFTSIVLRINPSDGDETMRSRNQDFLSTLTSVRDAVRRFDFDEARNLADTLSDKAEPILKNEWERVKKGELIYRLTQYAAAFVVVTGLLSGLFLVYRAYHNAPIQVRAPANQPINQTR
jgi:hypothetical protein